jgi:predicted acylesterase/phospholipase RssA
MYETYDTLVLSGASSKCFSILGAVQYAQDNFLLKKVNTYIGTSAGAMLSYLLCIGYTPLEIMVYICTNQLLDRMQNFNIVAMIQGRGAISYHYLQEHLEKLTISKIGYLPTMEDLHVNYGKTFIAVTHNITDDCTEYLKWETHPHLPCITAIRMSSNLPLVFENFKYGHSYYVDGGISDNFAIQVADNMDGVKKVLGFNLSANSIKNMDMDSDTLEFIYKLIFVPINQGVQYKINQVNKDKCTVVNITSSTHKFFDFNINTKDKMEMFVHGYKQMETFNETKSDEDSEEVGDNIVSGGEDNEEDKEDKEDKE